MNLFVFRSKNSSLALDWITIIYLLTVFLVNEGTGFDLKVMRIPVGSQELLKPWFVIYSTVNQ